MSNNSQHVIRSAEGGWSVKKGGSIKATKVFKTQQEAIEYGRAVAKNQNAEFYIHGLDGAIREKFSYRNTDSSAESKRED